MDLYSQQRTTFAAFDLFIGNLFYKFNLILLLSKVLPNLNKFFNFAVHKFNFKAKILSSNY